MVWRKNRLCRLVALGEISVYSGGYHGFQSWLAAKGLLEELVRRDDKKLNR